jgi:hypothetical protein
MDARRQGRRVSLGIKFGFEKKNAGKDASDAPRRCVHSNHANALQISFAAGPAFYRLDGTLVHIDLESTNLALRSRTNRAAHRYMFLQTPHRSW